MGRGQKKGVSISRSIKGITVDGKGEGREKIRKNRGQMLKKTTIIIKDRAARIRHEGVKKRSKNLQAGNC